MPNELEIKDFDWRQCPWCGVDYKERDVLRTRRGYTHRDLPSPVFVECLECGVVYSAEMRISWQAKLIKAIG